MCVRRPGSHILQYCIAASSIISIASTASSSLLGFFRDAPEVIEQVVQRVRECPKEGDSPTVEVNLEERSTNPVAEKQNVVQMNSNEDALLRAERR